MGTAALRARARIECDRAARALARNETERALVHATQARQFDPQVAAPTVLTLVQHRLSGQLRTLDTGPIVAAMSPVAGWLTADEADLLARATATGVDAGDLVEIGSYCGRSTVVIALAVAQVAPDRRIGRLLAIDPHEGYAPAGGQNTYSALMTTLQSNDVVDVVRVVRARSTDVEMASDLGMVFVDGLHDLASVSADRDHVIDRIRPGGLLVFHDYRPDYPGVVDAVDEVLLSGHFTLAGLSQSLVVLLRPGVSSAAQPRPLDWACSTEAAARSW